MKSLGLSDEITTMIEKVNAQFAYAGMPFTNFKQCCMLAALVYLTVKKKVNILYDVKKGENGEVAYLDISSDIKYDFESIVLTKATRSVALVSSLEVDDEMYALTKDGLSLISQMFPVCVFKVVDLLLSKQDSKDFLISFFEAELKCLNSRHSAISIVSIPKEIAELTEELLDGKPGRVLNLFSGIADYAFEMKKYSSYTGMEKDTLAVIVAKWRICISGLNRKVNIVEFDEYVCASDNYDTILSFPPYGQKIIDSTGRKEDVNTFVLKYFINSSNENINLCLVTNLGMLQLNYSMNLRKLITEKGFLDKVILLPSKLMKETSIPLALILLKKNRGANKSIQLIDASDAIIGEDKRHNMLNVESVMDIVSSYSHSRKVEVTDKDIIENNFSWSVGYYINETKTIIPEGYKIYKFRDLAERISLKITNVEKGRRISITSIPDDVYTNYKYSTDFEESTELKGVTKLTQPALLINTINKMKTMYCEASEKDPVFLSRNIIAFSIDTSKIDVGFLCLKLSEVNINNYSSQILIPTDTIQNIPLIFPDLSKPDSIEKQREVYATSFKVDRLAKAKEIGLMQIIENQREDFLNTIRIRKHTMKSDLNQIDSAVKLIDYYLNKQIETDFIKNIKRLTAKLSQALQNISDQVSHLTDVEEFHEPILIKIINYFNEIVQNHDYNLNRYSLRFNPDLVALNEISDGDINKLCINIAPEDLQIIVTNILDNAKNHGFTMDKTDYYVEIGLTVDSERNMYKISFSNNGNPLPKGLDKKRYGIRGEKAGPTGNTGIGGNIVKNFTSHYNGDYDIYSSEEITVVEVYLPIQYE